MSQLRVVTWQLRTAVGAALGAFVLLAATSWRVTHLSGLPSVNNESAAPPRAQLGSYRGALASELDHAVDFDPFQPERKRPNVRYELPGAAPSAIPAASAPVAEQVELLGTVVIAGGRSFATCQAGGGTQIVHVGEKFAGLTLKSVEQGSAVFVSPTGKTVTVYAKKSGS